MGLSDHTMDVAAPVVAVALGACIIEKHLTLSRNTRGRTAHSRSNQRNSRPWCSAVRTAEKALGEVYFGLSASEERVEPFVVLFS